MEPPVGNNDPTPSGSVCLGSGHTVTCRRHGPRPNLLAPAALGLRDVRPLRSCTWRWRIPKRRLTARLVDNVKFTVKVVAEKPEQVFTVVKFNSEALGFLTGSRREAGCGDDDPFGEFALRDGADYLPDCSDIYLIVRRVPFSLNGDAAANEGGLIHRHQVDASIRPRPGAAYFVKLRDLLAELDEELLELVPVEIQKVLGTADASGGVGFLGVVEVVPRVLDYRLDRLVLVWDLETFACRYARQSIGSMRAKSNC